MPALTRRRDPDARQWICTCARSSRPHAHDNYRVILKHDGLELEVGSIGIQHGIGATEYWAWGIDTVIPMRTHQTQGRGTDRADCMRQFRAAWATFAADEANLTEFLAAKRRARRTQSI